MSKIVDSWAESNSNILCRYTNESDFNQCIRLRSGNGFIERIVVSGSSVEFKAKPEDILEVDSYSSITQLITEKIKCSSLQIKASKILLDPKEVVSAAIKKNEVIEDESICLELMVELPEDISSEKLQEIVRQATLKADGLHRSNGGNGLQIDLVEVFEESQVPEGSRK